MSVTIQKGAKSGWELRGDCRKLLSAKEQEVILSGPSDTGKTIACCIKAHLICCRYPGAQGAIIRKTNKSLAGTVCRTFEKVVANQGIEKYGGESPSLYLYHNGSRIWLGGMDNPDKVLGAERDFIYTNQTEELTLNDWEYLVTRCSGRGAIIPHPQLFGDCNPGGSKHWIRIRAQEGKLRLLVTNHRDNPTLFDAQGVVTPDGEKRLSALQSLTGIRRKRLFQGNWSTAEGVVYDNFDPQVHVKVRPVEEMRRWLLCQDEGYTNPATIMLVGEDSDTRWHVFREFYRSGVLQSAIVQKAKLWATLARYAAQGYSDEALEQALARHATLKASEEGRKSQQFLELDSQRCTFDVVDEAAAGLIADLQAAGIPAVGAKGRVLDGIQSVQNRLAVAGDGLPRLTIDPGCTNVLNEFESYVWEPDKPKDTPHKEFDHAMDALRYLSIHLAVPSGSFDSAALAASATGRGGEDLFGGEFIEMPRLDPNDM